MLFPEAFDSLEQYSLVTRAFPRTPVLANITEFGKTPLFTQTQLAGVGVKMALYPLSAFRAMSAAALRVYEEILKNGTQEKVLSIMQSRNDLYQHLSYHQFEDLLDRLFKKKQ